MTSPLFVGPASARTLRRTIVAIVCAAGPLVTACQLALDFDRTPLQNYAEGGGGGTDSAVTPIRDATPDRQRSETGPEDAGSDVAEPKDAGNDARDN